VWAAIRYRPAQALVMVVLSALITACAVFAPLYERAVEQSLLREGLKRHDAIQTALVMEAVALRDVAPSPERPRSAFPAQLASLYDGGSDLWSGRVRYVGVAREAASVTVLGPQDTCRGLQLVSGACPTQPFQVAVSEAEARVQGWSLGAMLNVVEDLPPTAQPNPFQQPFVIAAIYRQLDDPGHWVGFVLQGRAGKNAQGRAATPLMDAWVTPESTFTSAWKLSRVQVTYLLDRDAVALDGLDAIPAALDATRAKASAMVPSVSVRSNVGDLVTGVVEGQRQARTIVPLLMGQLAVLAVVVLGLVAAAAVEQRRPELALGRLRGRGPAGAARMVMTELGAVVAAGVPVGFLLAVALGAVARTTWLPEGVPAELPVATVAAAGVAFAAALLAVAVVARPTLREPISALLRRIPARRRGWTVGLVDAAVVAVAAAGVLTLAGGNVSGPLVLATPTLLALALGLTLAHVLVPLADLLARRMTARGWVVGALTAVQVARRPAVRRIMAIITVATALTVFATDAVVVGARNRAERAQVESGAEAVLTTDASDITALLAATKAADPTGRLATPVVTVRQGSSTALTTLAVQPTGFASVAEFPRQRGAFDWAAIEKAPPPQVVVHGRSLSVTLSDIKLSEVLLVPDIAPRQPLSFDVFVTPPGNPTFTVTMGEFLGDAKGPLKFTQDVSCTEGCSIAGFGISTPPGFNKLLRGTFTVGSVAMDGGAPTTLAPVSLWLPTGEPNADKKLLLDYAKPVETPDPTTIAIELQTQQSNPAITSAGSAAPVPALVVGSLPAGSKGDLFQAAGLDGTPLPMARTSQVPYAPGGGDGQAIVSLDALLQRSTQLSAQALTQVWLADAASVPAVTAALESAGVGVTHQELRSDRQALFDNSASAWGLQLALVVGVVALLIAALVILLVAATSWRSRSRDYAALRMAGVGGAALRRVGLAEQCTVVLVGVLVGALCGLLGAQLAMPIVPFFTVPSTVFPVDTTPAATPIIIAALTALVALLVVGAVVGVRLAGRAPLSRVRDPL